MGSLVELGLANALIAAALAAVALIVGRYSRRPALVHALWALVLVKLVTPPLIPLPLPLPDLSRAEAPPAREGPAPIPPPVIELASSLPPPAEVPALPAPPPMKLEDLIPDPTKLLAGEMPVVPTLPPPAPAAMVVREIVLPPTPSSPAATRALPAAPTPWRVPWGEVATFVGWAWLTGAGACFALALWRITCFQRLLRHARPASLALQRQAEGLASQLGLRRCPRVFLLPGPVPPLLWAVGGRARLFFPGNLLPRLDDAGREALLTHELAHLARRDHWMRWLELLAGCAYWWYPVMWLARSRMQAAEEECCDAWVVSSLPGHGPAYAGALLETIDFLARCPAALPPAASGFGRVHRLKRRLMMIVQGSTPRNLSLLGKLLVLALAAALPLTPGRARPAAGPPVKKENANSADKAKPDKRGAEAPQSPTFAEPDRYAPTSRALAGNGGQVWQAAVSPDGKTLAVVQGGLEGEGALTLWDLPAGTERVTVTEARPIRSVGYSRDGKHLATGDYANNVTLRDPKTGSVKKTFPGHTAPVSAVAFTADGTMLISGSVDKTVRYWSIDSGKSTRTLGGIGEVVSLCVSPDGKALVVGCRNSLAHVYDLATGKRSHILKGHTNGIESCAVAPDNDTIVTASSDRTLKFWSAKTGKTLSTVLAHDAGINAVAFLDGGKALATVSDDRTIKLWDVESKAMTAVMTDAHTGSIRALAVSKDGKTLVSGAFDRLAKLWGLDTREEQRKLQPRRYSPETTYPILALAVSPDGATLAVGGEEKLVKLLDAATGRVKHLLAGHDDMVGGVSFSPNGKLLATAGFDGEVRLWDVATGKPVRTLKGHVNWVFCVAFSPDGRQLASGGYDKSIRLWDVASGKEVARLSKHKGGVRTVAWTRDGARLASAGTDKMIRVWDLSKKETVQVLRGHEDVVRSIAFSPDGRRIVSGSEDNTVRLWDVAAEKQLASVPSPQAGGVRAVAWSPRGATIAAGGQGRTVSILDPRTLANRGNSFEHAGAVTALAYSPDSLKLYTASEDMTVRAREGLVPTLRPVVSYPSQGGLMKFARFSPDGKWLALGGGDRMLEVRDARFGRNTLAVSGMLGNSVLSIAVAPDGKTLALGCMDNKVRLYEMPNWRLKGTIEGHEDRVWSVAFSPDGKKLVTGDGSWSEPDKIGAVKIWDVKSQKREATLPDVSAAVQAVAWSKDGKYLAVGSRDRLARIYDARTYKALHKLEGHAAEVRSLAFSPDSKSLVTGDTGSDPRAKVWSVADGKEIASLKTSPSGINCVAWSPDGKYIAVSSKPPIMNGVAQLWQVGNDQGKPTFKLDKELKGLAGYALSVAFSPDSKTLALGGGVTTTSGEVMLFDVPSGRALVALHGHANWVEALAFTPDGKTLVSGGGFNNQGGELRYWEVNRGGWVAAGAHKQEIMACQWSPDGKTIATGGYDGLIKLWDARTGKLKTTFEAEQGGVRCLAFTRDSKLLASGGHEGTVKVWDLTDDKDAVELAKFDRVVNAVAFSPDGKLLAACSADPYNRDKRGGVKVIEIATGREKTGDWKDRAAMGLAFSPDGKELATASLEAPGLVLYTVATGKRARQLRGSAGVYAVEYSKDGKLLASAHFSGNIELHDTRSWAAPLLCTGNTSLSPALGISPDGAMLASASHDKTVKLFDLRQRLSAGGPPRMPLSKAKE